MDHVPGPLNLILGGAPLLTLLLACWVFGRTSERAADRFGLARPAIADLTPAVIASSVFFARAVAVAPHWRVLLSHPLDFLRVTDHLSLSGGVVGAIAGVAVFSRRNRLPLWPVMTLYLVALPLGLATHELGCLLRDDCYGRPAPVPLGIVFPGFHTPRYPVELYAAVTGLLLFAGLWKLTEEQFGHGNLAFMSIAAVSLSQALLNLLRLRTEAGMADREMLALAALGAVATLMLIWRLSTNKGRLDAGAAVIAANTNRLEIIEGWRWSDVL